MFQNSILRHKPGLLSKAKIAHNTAAGTDEADPFAANYTLLKLDSLVLSFKGLSRRQELMPVSTMSEKNKQWGSVTTINAADPAPIDNSNTAKQLKMVAADFAGQGKDNVAVISQDANGKITIAAYEKQGADKMHLITSFGLQDEIRPAERCWCGSIADGIYARLALVWIDAQKNLRIWISDTDIIKNGANGAVTFSGKANIDETNFDVSIGVFSGEKNNEIAMFYKDTEQKSLWLSIYQVKNKVMKCSWHKEVSATDDDVSGLCVRSGAFLQSTLTDGLILCWYNKHSSNAQLQSWQIIKNKKGEHVLEKIDELPAFRVRNGAVRIAAGDLNNDGVEELVIAHGDDFMEGGLELQTFSFNNSLLFERRSAAKICADSTSTLMVYDFKIAIATLDENAGIDENINTTGIAIAAIGVEKSLMPQNGYARCNVGFIPMNDPALAFNSQFKEPVAIPGMFSKNIIFDPAAAFDHYSIHLIAGDFNGTRIMVGKPTEKSFDSVNSVIAIVNCPPVAAAFKNQEGTMDCSSRVTFSKTDATSMSVGLNLHTTSNISDTLGGTLGQSLIGSLTRSVNKTYGENFSRTTQESKAVTVGFTVNAENEDIIVLSVNTFKTWEYPVFQYGDKKPRGHILVISPAFGESRIRTVAGNDLSSMYKSRHTTGNLLSYSSTTPADFGNGQTNMCRDEISVGRLGSTDIHFNIDKSSSTTEDEGTSISTHISNQQNFNASPDFLKGISLGITHNYDDTYTKSESKNQTVHFNKSVQINLGVNAHGLDDTMAYTITPFAYYNGKNGYLRVEYAVLFPQSSSWFKKNYKNADPAFHLPWTGENNLLTRDIDFADKLVDGKKCTDIEVTVHNDTLTGTDKIAVEIYEGSPFAGGRFIAKSILNPIPPRELSVCTFSQVDMTMYVNNGEATIYAVIDPADDLSNKYAAYTKAETKPGDKSGLNNKIGFAVYREMMW